MNSVSYGPPRLNDNRCLCRTFGHLFSTPRDLDRHRRAGNCSAPESTGLVLVARVRKRPNFSDSPAPARLAEVAT